LEEVFRWEETNKIKKKCENEIESEENRVEFRCSRSSLSLCFVTSEVEKSKFYRDLEEVLGWEESNKKSR
jgi:hypothetical protein